MNEIVLSGIVLGTLAVALILSRYHHGERLQEWKDLLEPEDWSGQDVAELCALDGVMADDAYAGAIRARDQRHMTEAVRLLDLACQVIEEATPSRVARLRAMGRTVRMTMAILPMRAIPPRSFRLGRMMALAGIGACLHRLLVAPAGRFVVRVRVLTVGFRLVVRLMRRSADAAISDPQRLPPWQRFERGLTDWQTLDAEHLETFRVLVAAVRAEYGVLLPHA